MIADPSATDIVELFHEVKAAVDAGFERIQWLEQTIARYMEQYPDRAAWIWDCFKYGNEMPAVIYEHPQAWMGHMEELIRRAACGESVQHPTHADMLFIFKEISARIPLHGEKAQLYQWLFADVFPDKAHEIGLQPGQPMPRDCKPYYDMVASRKGWRKPPDPKRYWEMLADRAAVPQEMDTRSHQLRLFR